MTRRGANEGSIRYREAEGRWEARYRGADGRRHSLFAKTRREAQERLRVALVATDQRVELPGRRLTVGAYLDEWLATSVQARCRPSTADNYARVVRLYILPAIGHQPMAKLTPDHVQRMLNRLTARDDLSPTTVRYAYSILRIALGRALKAGKVLRNVCTLVDPPAKAQLELRPLTADEVGIFLDSVAGSRDAPLYTVAIATGLRQGELLALRWEDIDLEAGTLTVRHTRDRHTGALGEPKTERAKRTLRLGVEVVSALRTQRRRQLEERVAAGSRWQETDAVFATSLGGPLDAANVLHAFQRAVVAAGLPHQRFHDLRHACATLLLEQGEELGVVSKVLGHANVATTADVYAHLTPAMTGRVAERMDAVLRHRVAATS